MVSSETKIGKMFHNDKEYAEELIKRKCEEEDKKRKEGRNHRWRLLAHKFFIHNWKTIKNGSGYSASKCKFCGDFQCVENIPDSGVVYSVVTLVVGVILPIYGMIKIPHLASPTMIVIGLLCLWNFIKRMCENYWKDWNK